MAIDAEEARPGLTVFYQQKHMRSPEYGTITSVGEPNSSWDRFVHVRFLGEEGSKACHPRDLFWPPDFCARDGAGPPGQPYSTDYP